MSNHIHLAIRTGKKPLSSAMHRLLGSYAIYFNIRHRRSGHLFQNRYKSIVIEEDSYLATLISYIHSNPLRSGLVNEVSELSRYKWSGHLALIGKKNNKWQDTKFVLDFFGGRKSYLKYLKDQNNEEIPDLDGGGLRRSLMLKKGQKPKRGDSGSVDNRILGNNEYANYLLEKLNIESPKPAPQLLEQLRDSVCRYYGVTDQQLKGSSRQRSLSNARALIATLATISGFSGASIAKELNLTQSAIIKAVERGKEILRKSPKIKDEIGY